MNRRAGWVGMLVVLVGVLFVGITDDRGPATPGQRAQNLASSVMCPTCRGQSVADSDSSAARGIRAYIDDHIAAGDSDDEIRDVLASRYGEDILLTPERGGLAGLVWVLPVVALILALAGVAWAFHRWRGQAAGAVATEADRDLVGRALDSRHVESGAR